MAPRRCVIGVGSPHGDDQIGWMIADAVLLLAADVCHVYKVASPLEILDRIDGTEWLGICDACRGAGSVGDWKSWAWPDQQIISQEFSGSHGIGLPATLDLATRLGRLPETTMIWGVEIGDCHPGDAVSASASAAIPVIANAILRELMLAR
ncbi:MAG: hydrogenase maturation protease, partial [Planctomycetaceae bacterium]|nr:hydrogenase maturation protease [Planctomycetaceae bacterium]